jgi:DNA-binding winged helix-turn-helix (wHTH) protein/Flp pilus assembly protein TadD
LGDTQYEFGCFLLDPSEQRLLRENTPVPLAPKAFELLVNLVASHGHLVTRETLMQSIWPDSFVEETNLTVNISLLRRILGNMPDGQPWIATVPKRGYRFDGPVTLRTVSNGAAAAPVPAPAAAEIPAPPPLEAPSPPASISEVAAPAQPAHRRWPLAVAIAVLIALCLWAGLRLARPRLTAGQDHSPDREGSTNSHAQELYLEGRVAWNHRSLDSVRRSIDLFTQATDLDPRYAAAWSGLADAWILAGSYGNSFLAPKDAMPRAKEAVQKALALDEGSPEAHTSLAYVHLVWDWDFAAAEKEFRRALELNPSYVNAHHWYSHELVALGRMGESHEQSELALGLAPTDVVINEHMAWHHMMAREYDRSISQADKAVELDPAFVQAHRVLALDLLYTGRAKEACTEFEKGVDLSHGDPVATAYLARCYALTHREGDAHRLVAGLEQAAAERYISAAEIAAVYAALNDAPSALKWLDRAIDERAGSVIYLNADRVWDPLRSNPAFLEDLHRINLPALVDEGER